jgi:mannose-6-phosphate isomerase-like protein (cupin superfamily)
MYVIRGADAPTYQLPGVHFTALASPSRGSAETCAWLLTVDPELVSPESHVLDRDEVFMVLDGAIQLSPDGDVVSAGDAVIVPAGEPIQVVNTGDAPARVHVAIRAGFTATSADGTPIGTPPWAA